MRNYVDDSYALNFVVVKTALFYYMLSWINNFLFQDHIHGISDPGHTHKDKGHYHGYNDYGYGRIYADDDDDRWVRVTT